MTFVKAAQQKETGSTLGINSAKGMVAMQSMGGDTDDMPPELAAMLGEQGMSDNNLGDDFDPVGLLMQPLDDSQSSNLNLSKGDLGFAPEPTMVSEDSSNSSKSANHQYQQEQIIKKQQEILARSLSPQQKFNAYDKGSSSQSSQMQQHYSPQNSQQQFSGYDQGQAQSPELDSVRDIRTQQQQVQARVQEVQQQIQKVQQQIQQVRMQSSQLEGRNAMQGFSGQMGSPIASQMGMLNHAGEVRSPPGRSSSLPAQRMVRGNLPGAPLTNNSFIMQQQQSQNMHSLPGSLSGSIHNNAMGGFVQMEPMMEGYGQPIEGYGQQGLDNNSIRSVPASMNMNNMGMMQTMEAMNMHMNGMAGMMHRNSLPINPSQNMMGNDIKTHPSMAHPGELLTAGSFDPLSSLGMAMNGGQGLEINEAMEKLCESMRRSAMSRSLVKQLSGRSLTQQNSARNLTKQGSARNLTRSNSGLRKQLSGRNLTKQLSGRNLQRANSGRSVQRTHSGRQLMGEEGGSNLPVRRLTQDMKHRIQRESVNTSQAPPGRGIFRHKSQSALMDNKPRTILQIDDNSLGIF